MKKGRVSLGIATALLLAVAACASHAGMEVSGYTQARYNFFDEATGDDDEFDLRRVRLKFKGEIDEQGTVATLQIDLSKLDESGSGEVGLKDATIAHPLGSQWSARLGYASTLFGFEVPYSSSSRLPFERSRAAKKLFPGERDTGLYLIRAPQGHSGPEFLVAYTDGLGDWEDEKQSAFVTRLQWGLPGGGVAGVSYLKGDRTPTTEEFDQDVLGVHAQWNGSNGFNLQGEYYDGKLLGVDVDGWYGQAEYQFPGTAWTGYYRYDTFDDGDPEHDTYSRNTFGAAYQLDKKQRVSLEVESLDTERRVSETNWGVQWQFKY